MKKLFKIASLLSVSALILSGCLKDKGFDNNEYGINLTDGSPAAVAFADGAKAIASGAITADPTPQTVSYVINYTGATPPATDIVVSLTLSNAVIAAYNTANGTAIAPFPAGSVQIPTSVTILAGERFATLDVVIPNATVLNPNIQYGFGATITGVTGGVKIASNKKSIFGALNIKNKYDGRYKLSGIHNRSPNNFPFSNVTVDLVTTGPSSVAYFQPNRNGGEYSNVIGTGPGVISSYGTAICPNLTFNPTTNNVIAVAPYSGAIFMGLGPNPGNWNPTTKKVVAQYYYTTGANQDFNNRGWSDTLTYTGPRP